MKLSTRSRYGVRLMIALARNNSDKPIFLKDIAASEAISEKYLSLIVIPLRAANLIHSIRGARGGYTLAHDPHEITLRHVVEALEGETCLANCVKQISACDRVAVCPTRDIWAMLGNKIAETLDGITLAQLAANNSAKNKSSKEETKN